MIVVRYWISGLVTRAIVSFELSCLTHRDRVEGGEKDFVIEEREDSRQSGMAGNEKVMNASTPFGMERP